MYCLALLLVVGGSAFNVQLVLPSKDKDMAVLLQDFTLLKQQLQEEVLGLREEALNVRKESLNLREEALNLRKETLRLREEVDDMIQSQGCLPVANTSEANEVVNELVNEVKALKNLIANTSETNEVVNELVNEVKSLKNLIANTSEINEVVNELVNEVKSLKNLIAGGLEAESEILPQISSKLDTLGKVVGVMRSEVRLISQHKLTWQNGTNGQYQSDFIVDGVYTLSRELDGNNPIQHTAPAQRNNVLMIDLGGIFKIHTVKLWSRLDCCQEQNIGVVVFAGDVLIGTITQQKNLYNLPVSGNVFARNVLLKTTGSTNLMFIEVQVFGNGPFAEDEI